MGISPVFWKGNASELCVISSQWNKYSGLAI